MTVEKINSELIISIIIGDVPNIIRLVDSGEDVNYHHEKTHSPLYHAYYHLPDMVKYLLENGANPCVKSTVRRTSLDDIYFLYDISKHYYNTSDRYSYFLEYGFQKMMIENYPETVIHLKKYDIINDEIEKEYQHLLHADKLNLL